MGGFEPVGGEGGSPQPPSIGLPPIIVGGSSAGSTCVDAGLGQVTGYAGALAAWLEGYSLNLVGGLVSAVKAIGAAVVAWVQWLGQTWLGQIVKGIWDKLKAIFRAVVKELKLIIGYIRQYEKLVLYWQQRILGPVINLLQALRRTLIVFRIFHFKFASQLDAYLSGIESRLYNIFLYYQRQINQIIDYLDFIIDPFGLITEALFVQSAVRAIPAVWTQILGDPGASITPQQNAAAAARTQFYTAKTQTEYMKGLAAGGTNPDDTAIVQAQFAGYQELGFKV